MKLAVMFLGLVAAGSAIAGEGTSVRVNFSAADAVLTADDSRRLVAAFGEGEKVFETEAFSVRCASEDRCRLTLDLRHPDVEVNSFERIARLGGAESQRFADALDGLDWRTSPGIGEVKHFVTTDRVVRIVCQISENFPDLDGPRCHAAISLSAGR